MSRNALVIIGVLGVLAVSLGAFGAHALRPKLEPAQIQVFNTAVQYHFIHLLAMLGMWILASGSKNSLFQSAYWAFLAGTILFSGSLYLLACRDLLDIGYAGKLLGPMTPIGGLCFILGWIMLILAALKEPGTTNKT